MFARTQRLTLRPGWPEDAAALTAAIGYEAVARMTSRVPSPYALADAEAFLALPARVDRPTCLVFAHDGEAPRLVGGVGLHDTDGEAEIGYWLTPDAWGRGYATEAARAVLGHAHDALGIRRVLGGHYADNPASGRVLGKLGFVMTGTVADYPCQARGGPVAAVRYALELGARALPLAA
ncbi:GNAT family N-acetyltransferase [Sphingomonas bacterium]|uniref:GNAT family N-acetyltransferase n=1 Tax=Sphingomonas bacterium TaxID=1895847 RepID=UPI001577653A|nr:GNAT family N-acetyltransferase [Sphingomonas bacterium]